MRARLMMKLMGIVVMLILTIVSARSCNGSSSSPLNPSTLLQNGVSGVCANQAATAAAAGSDTTPSLQLPPGDSNLASMARAAGIAPGALSCPTTTVSAP